MNNKLICFVLAALFIVTGLTGCKESSAVVPVTREDGSGTRSAFANLFGISENGIDFITEKAEVTNSTSVMLSSVAGCRTAVGYTSLGVVRGEVKVLKIDGVSPSESTIRSGEYSITRDFLLVVPEKLSAVAEDFLKYIESSEAVQIITELGYYPDSVGGEYRAASLSGKLSIAGSTSVAPCVEACAEAYMLLNPKVNVEIQQTGSSSGILSVSEGICDLGMSSRSLTGAEKNGGLTPVTLARDGIAVIVNPANPLNDISSQDVKKIFTGETESWSEITGYGG